MNGRCVLTDEIGNPFGILVGIGDGEGATGVEIFLTVDKEERCHGLLAVLFEERQRLAGERLIDGRRGTQIHTPEHLACYRGIHAQYCSSCFDVIRYPTF